MINQYISLKRLLSLLVLLAFVSGLALPTFAQRRKPPRRTTYRRPAQTASGSSYRTLPANTTIRVRMNDSLNSKNARVGDTFSTTVVNTVRTPDGTDVIPDGSTILGRVSSVQAAQKGGKPGTIDVRFYQVRMPNGRTYAIDGSLSALDEDRTESDSEGTARGQNVGKRKIVFIGGGALGGGLLGAIAGGGKGAAIGAIVGAGAGLLGDRLVKGKEAEVNSGTEFGVILNRSASLPAAR